MTRVCRACLQIITSAECYNLNQPYPNSECCVLRDRCKACVPEMDLDLTTDAVLCGLCYNTFNLFYHLRLKCLETEKKLRGILQSKNCIDLGLLVGPNHAAVDVTPNFPIHNGPVSAERANQPSANNIFEFINDINAIKQECEQETGSIPAGAHQGTGDLNAIFDGVTDARVLCKDYCESPDLVNNHESKANIPSTVEYEVEPKLNGSVGGSSSDFVESSNFNRLRAKKAFRCLDCDYSTSHRMNLQNHIKSHFGNKPYKCNLCGYKALQKCFLKSHMMTHSGTKPFKCNLCDYKTAYRGNLQTHLRKHTGEKPYKCDICNNSYTQSNSLNRHIKTHANAKPFKCCMCEYRTMYKNHLRNHMMLHTGEKTYVCHVCCAKFSQKLELANHVRTHANLKI